MTKYGKKTVVFFVLLALSFTSAGRLSAQEHLLRAGAARVDITPPVNPEYPPSGKYDHEKLYIRAIVIDNGIATAAMIAGDVNDIYNPVWEAAAPLVARELNCPPDNLIMTPTHTHSGRTAGPPPGGQQNPAQDTDFMVKAVLDAVRQAKATMRPAKVGYGTGEAYLNVNRDVISKKTRLWTQAANLEGPSDKTLAVIMFTDLEGFPIAGYMNYAMHPVNGYLSSITSADFAGAASCYVENAFGNNMVMIYSQGASGDQNPRWLRPGTNAMASESGVKITGFELVREEVEAPLREKRVPYQKMDPKVAENLEHWMDALGTIMGEEAIRVMTNIDDLNSNVRIWGKHEILTLPGRTRTNTGREGAPGTYEDGPDVNLRLGLLGIGDIAVTCIDAEIYNRFAQILKKESPMANTMMVSIANGKANSGYVITDDAYGRYTFQVLNNKIRPGNAEKGIIDRLLKLINEYNAPGVTVK